VRVRWRAALGFGITLFLLWWVLRGVDVGEVWERILGADLWLLALAVTITTATFAIRALRWKLLLEPIHSGTGFRNRFAAVNIGFMANNLLPARVGEFARAYALARLEPVSVSAAFGSLVVERFLDGISILVLMLVAVAAPSFPEGVELAGRPLASVVNGVLAVLVVLLVFLLLLVLFPRRILALTGFLVRPLPEDFRRPVLDALEAFLDGLGVLQSPRLLGLALLWSLGLWAWQSLAFWVGFRAFHIEVGYAAALFVNAMVAFAVAVPSSPGFFGTFHAGAKVGLGVYGVPPGPTLAFAFGYHLGGFIPVTLIGLYYVWRLGLSLSEVGSSEEEVEEAVEGEHPGLAAAPAHTGKEGG